MSSCRLIDGETHIRMRHIEARCGEYVNAKRPIRRHRHVVGIDGGQYVTGAADFKRIAVNPPGVPVKIDAFRQLALQSVTKRCSAAIGRGQGDIERMVDGET